MSATNAEALLEMNGFSVGFGQGDDVLWAVEDVDISVMPGETIGLVGESGCGKSVLSQSILRLLEHEQSISYKGLLRFRGSDLLSMSVGELRELRGAKVSMIFQDPLSSLDPLCAVGVQIVEVIRAHCGIDSAQARSRALALMEEVGIPDAVVRFKARPGEFSGGQLQRIMIAMALSTGPDLLIADEPTTALDVTTQAQILELLSAIVRERGMALIFISHDLDVVASVCERVNVMYRGRIVESAPVEELFEHPVHPYTRGLLAAMPPVEGTLPERLAAIPGAVPPLEERIEGCAFGPRCNEAIGRCTKQPPMLCSLGAREDHRVACWKTHCAYDEGVDCCE